MPRGHFSNTGFQHKQTNKSMIQMCPYRELIQVNPRENYEFYFNPVMAFIQLQTLSPRKWIVCDVGCLLSPFDSYTFSDDFIKTNPFPPAIWFNDKTASLAEQSSRSTFVTLPWNWTFKPQNLKSLLGHAKVEDTHLHQRWLIWWSACQTSTGSWV